MQHKNASGGGVSIRRGMTMAYRQTPNTPLRIISDPYEYNGMTVVTARTCEKSAKSRTVGMYSVDALVQYEEVKKK